MNNILIETMYQSHESPSGGVSYIVVDPTEISYVLRLLADAKRWSQQHAIIDFIACSWPAMECYAGGFMNELRQHNVFPDLTQMNRIGYISLPSLFPRKSHFLVPTLNKRVLVYPNASSIAWECNPTHNPSITIRTLLFFSASTVQSWENQHG